MTRTKDNQNKDRGGSWCWSPHPGGQNQAKYRPAGTTGDS